MRDAASVFEPQMGERPMSYDDFVAPELLPPPEDGVFQPLLTNPEAKPVLRDVVESFLRFHVTNVEVRNAEPPYLILTKNANVST